LYIVQIYVDTVAVFVPFGASRQPSPPQPIWRSIGAVAFIYIEANQQTSARAYWPVEVIMGSRSLRLAQVQSHLRRDVETAGGQSEWSRQTGVTRSYLNRVLHGQKPIGQQICRALGLRKVTSPTETEVLQLLHREIRKAGSQAEWARRNAVNRTYLNKVLNRRKSAGPAILDALQIETVTVYI